MLKFLLMPLILMSGCVIETENPAPRGTPENPIATTWYSIISPRPDYECFINRNYSSHAANTVCFPKENK